MTIVRATSLPEQHVEFLKRDVGSVHCMAESLGGVYDLPHGVCNAILLPYVMESRASRRVELLRSR